MLLFCQKSFYKDVFGVCVSALVWLGRGGRGHSVCAMAEELRQGRMLLWNDWTCNTSITALKTTSIFNMVTSNTALEITSSLIQHGKLWLPREQPEFQSITLTLTPSQWRDFSACQCCPMLNGILVWDSSIGLHQSFEFTWTQHWARFISVTPKSHRIISVFSIQ